jgi:hypothetical protein
MAESLELNRAKIAARLARRLGVPPWRQPRRLHAPSRPRVVITLPRHRTVSPGVARNTAKAAGWIK